MSKSIMELFKQGLGKVEKQDVEVHDINNKTGEDEEPSTDDMLQVFADAISELDERLTVLEKAEGNEEEETEEPAGEDE